MPGFKTNHGACNRIQLAFRVRFLTKQTLVCVSVCKNLSDTKKSKVIRTRSKWFSINTTPLHMNWWRLVRGNSMWWQCCALFSHTTNNLWQFTILLTTFFVFFAKYCDKLSVKTDFGDQHSSIRFNDCSNSKAIRKLLLLLKYCAWITLNKHTLRLHILGGALENLFGRSSSDDLMHSFGTTAQKPNLNGP